MADTEQCVGGEALVAAALPPNGPSADDGRSRAETSSSVSSKNARHRRGRRGGKHRHTNPKIAGHSLGLGGEDGWISPLAIQANPGSGGNGSALPQGGGGRAGGRGRTWQPVGAQWDQDVDDGSQSEPGRGPDSGAGGDPCVADGSAPMERLLAYLVMEAHRRERTVQLEQSLLMKGRTFLHRELGIKDSFEQMQMLEACLPLVVSHTTRLEEATVGGIVGSYGSFLRANALARGELNTPWSKKELGAVVGGAALLGAVGGWISQSKLGLIGSVGLVGLGAFCYAKARGRVVATPWLGMTQRVAR
nr:hypothetical protein [Tolivirales sp.]